MKSPIIIGLSVWSLALAALAVNEPSLVPVPQKMELHDGTFRLSPETRILANSDSIKTAELLAGSLRKSTGYPLMVSRRFFSGAPSQNSILLTTKDADANLGAEGYELTVATNSVVIRAPTQAGLFYGVQTLLQLLPPEIFSTNVVTDVDWQMPCVQITDWPRFKWRGFMLDVSRHFFNKQEVEQLLDVDGAAQAQHVSLASDGRQRLAHRNQKISEADERGRVARRRGFWPASNSTTAYGPDGRYGGFYTQDDIREVVAYAAARHITIVPEIEMPGHSLAALAAYPQFGTGDGPFAVPLKGGVNPGIYSPAKDGTFQFLDNVLAEVFQLFPEQIHSHRRR